VLRSISAIGGCIKGPIHELDRAAGGCIITDRIHELDEQAVVRQAGLHLTCDRTRLPPPAPLSVALSAHVRV